MTLLQMSAAGAVFIVIITVIRALAIHKLPKKTFLVLWAVALLRLLLPVSVPSVCSVYSLLDNRLPAAETTVVPAAKPVTAVPQMTALPEPAGRTVSGWTILWLVGMVLCAGYFAVTYWHCRREFQMSLPVDRPFIQTWLRSHRLKRPLAVRQSDRIGAPLTYGLLRPVILMPKSTDWDDETALQYVLAHEYVHVRRLDAGTKVLLAAALCLHWFNPLVWVLYFLANRDLELSCDEAVLRQFGMDTRAAYARVLVRMEERQSRGMTLCSGFSKNAIEERIVAIMKTKRTTIISVMTAVILVAATTAVFATSAATEPKPKAEAEDDYVSPGVVTSFTGDNGKTYYELSDGRVLEEIDYEKEFPTPDIEWWTYEEYRDWLEQQKKELPFVIGETAWANGEKFVWTQEMVDETIAMYEDILRQIQRGVKISKTVDGDPNLVISMDPSCSVSVQDYTLGVDLATGEQKVFGPCETPEELEEQVEQFCKEQTALGTMEQAEADQILDALHNK